MKVIRRNKKTGENKKINYPHEDINKPIVGLDSNILFYMTIIDEKPTYTEDEKLIYSESLTSDFHPEYSHLLINRGSWQIVSKTYPSIDQSKKKLYSELKVLIGEFSSYVSICKNIYDPLGITPEAIPEDLKNLILQVATLRGRAHNEIEALSTEKEAHEFSLKGEEISGFLNQLKSFL